MIRLLFVVVVAMSVIATENTKPHYDLKDAPELFEKFRIKYNRVYDDEEDKEIHFQAFVKTLERINEQNSSGDAVFDINKLADYTSQELEEITGFNPKKKDKKKKAENE